MAGFLTRRGAELGLDAAVGRATITAAARYLALLTAAPTKDTTPATMVEATFTYTRPQVEWDGPNGEPRTTSNTNEELIGPLADADGSQNVTHWAIVTVQAGTTGDCVAAGSWNTPRTPNAGDTLRVAAGDLDIAID